MTHTNLFTVLNTPRLQHTLTRVSLSVLLRLTVGNRTVTFLYILD